MGRLPSNKDFFWAVVQVISFCVFFFSYCPWELFVKCVCVRDRDGRKKKFHMWNFEKWLWDDCNILTLTEPSIEKQMHPVEGITLTRGRVEFSADATPTRSRWMSNNYITRCDRWVELVGVRQLKFNLQFEAVRTSSQQRASALRTPGWAAQQI